MGRIALPSVPFRNVKRQVSPTVSTQAAQPSAAFRQMLLCRLLRGLPYHSFNLYGYQQIKAPGGQPVVARSGDALCRKRPAVTEARRLKAQGYHTLGGRQYCLPGDMKPNLSMTSPCLSASTQPLCQRPWRLLSSSGLRADNHPAPPCASPAITRAATAPAQGQPLPQYLKSRKDMTPKVSGRGACVPTMQRGQGCT